MNEITCPKCQKSFEIDENSYASIVQQVRTEEFKKELNSRLKIEKEKFDKDLEIIKREQIEDKDKAINTLKDEYQNKLSNKDETIRIRDEEIIRIKEMKAQLSTKMVGETLEQHCENEFNKFRHLGFKNAVFEKDNVVSSSTGSKGDYIFKENNENKVEIVSIMFEMKNESDTTTTKNKNEHFYKELDKDRNEKGCEYAILVSLLEQDNELFNSGIVDVSHKFPKMYVIRPQFFIPMITLLRNAALKSMEYKNQLALIQNQNIEVGKFESELNDFKIKFGRSVKLWDDQTDKALKQIDSSIKAMENVRDNLLKAKNNLKIANSKSEDLSIKKLTKGNPTMIAKFNELREQD